MAQVPVTPAEGLLDFIKRSAGMVIAIGVLLTVL